MRELLAIDLLILPWWAFLLLDVVRTILAIVIAHRVIGWRKDRSGDAWGPLILEQLDRIERSGKEHHDGA